MFGYAMIAYLEDTLGHFSKYYNNNLLFICWHSLNLGSIVWAEPESVLVLLFLQQIHLEDFASVSLSYPIPSAPASDEDPATAAYTHFTLKES